MGLFQNKKKSPIDEAVDRAEQIFDETYRKELRDHGRAYFDQVIKDSATLFKQDLDATIIQVYTELKHHVTTQIDEQAFKHNRKMEEAQEAALQTVTKSVKELQEQYQHLGATLKKDVVTQESAMKKLFEENKIQVDAIKDAQEATIKSLTQSVDDLQAKHDQLVAALEQKVADQEASTIAVFDDNMAKVVEHYLLGALGDQFDLKSQVPAIIKQMEANKQAMVEDMKL